MNLPNILDNDHKSFLDAFKLISSDYEHLSIATGYWDLKVMKLILDHIDNYKKIKLLIGREPLLQRNNELGIEEPEPDYPDSDFFNDLQKIKPSLEYQKIVKKIKRLIDEERLEVRVYRKKFLHAKCYIFGSFESDRAIGIIGSSNFTKNGFTSNTELNALEDDHRIVTYEPKNKNQELGHLAWFDKMWNDEMTEKWNGDFLELIRTSPNGDLLFSPKEMYLRTLYELYKDEIKEESYDVDLKTKTPFEFQKENAKNLHRILDKNGVAMLADSVGLGKTISAILVMKEYKNQRIVVIAPKSLVGQWKKELAQQGLTGVRVIALQNKQEIIDEQKIDKFSSVNLFVIDESHHLKSSNGVRYEMLSDWIASEHNEEARVLLLTATPINNSLSDLTNQILLGARGDQDVFTLSVKNSEGMIVNRSFYEAIENIRKRINQNIARGEEDLDQIYKEARIILEPIIRNFVVRNTRESIKKLNINGEVKTFPETIINNIKYTPVYSDISVSPDFDSLFEYSIEQLADCMDHLIHPLDYIQKISPNKDEKENTLIYQIYQLLLSLSLVPYRWRMYDFKIYGKERKNIKNMRLRKKEKQKINMQLSMYGIIRTLFLKRLESSAYSLEASLSRYLNRIKTFEKILREENIIINLSDIDDIIDEYDFDDGERIEYDEDEIIDYAKKKSKEVDENINKKAIFKDIEKEKKLLIEIIKSLEKLKKKDTKIEDLKDRLRKKYNDNPEEKIIVFSFFSDTIEYIEDEISKDPEMSSIFKKSAFVTGSDRKEALECADRFSPVAREAKEVAKNKGELTYLFSTDVLSEGQNLQDCRNIINYDLHWNPVRMVQRNGRVNRLGSNYDEVYIYNFIPGDQLESYLGLMEKINNKINLIKHSIGNDVSVFDEDIDPRSYTDLYSEDSDVATERYKELEKDLETFSDDEFVKDLKNFYENSTEEEIRKMERIPFGQWSCVPQGFDGLDDVVVFGKFSTEDQENRYVFFGNNCDGDNIALIPNNVALNMIRSDVIKKQIDTIKIDKEEHFKIAKKFGFQIANRAEADETLTPTRQKVLGEAAARGWGPEEKEKLRATLTTRNVLLQRKVRRIVLRINSKLKENEVVDKEFKRLKDLLIDSEDVSKITNKEILFGFTDKF